MVAALPLFAAMESRHVGSTPACCRSLPPSLPPRAAARRRNAAPVVCRFGVAALPCTRMARNIQVPAQPPVPARYPSTSHVVKDRRWLRTAGNAVAAEGRASTQRRAGACRLAASTPRAAPRV